MTGAGEVLKADTDDLVMDELVFHEAMVFSKNSDRAVQVIFNHRASGRLSCEIFSRDHTTSDAESYDWQKHMTGAIRYKKFDPDPLARKVTKLQIDEIKDRCHERINAPDYYDRMKRGGFQFGHARQLIECVWRTNGEALAKLRIPKQTATPSKVTGIHRSLLDACIQLFAAVLPQDSKSLWQKSIYLPVKLENLEAIACKGSHIWSHVLSRPIDTFDTQMLILDIHLFDGERRQVGAMEGLHFKSVNRQLLMKARRKALTERLYEMSWLPKSLEDSDLIGAQLEDIQTQTEITDPSASGALHKLIPQQLSQTLAYFRGSRRNRQHACPALTCPRSGLSAGISEFPL